MWHYYATLIRIFKRAIFIQQDMLKVHFQNMLYRIHIFV